MYSTSIEFISDGVFSFFVCVRCLVRFLWQTFALIKIVDNSFYLFKFVSLMFGC